MPFCQTRLAAGQEKGAPTGQQCTVVGCSTFLSLLGSSWRHEQEQYLAPADEGRRAADLQLVVVRVCHEDAGGHGKYCQRVLQQCVRPSAVPVSKAEEVVRKQGVPSHMRLQLHKHLYRKCMWPCIPLLAP
jgi:hypothetical protein